MHTLTVPRIENSYALEDRSRLFVGVTRIPGSRREPPYNKGALPLLPFCFLERGAVRYRSRRELRDELATRVY